MQAWGGGALERDLVATGFAKGVRYIMLGGSWVGGSWVRITTVISLLITYLGDLRGLMSTGITRVISNCPEPPSATRALVRHFGCAGAFPGRQFSGILIITSGYCSLVEGY